MGLVTERASRNVPASLARVWAVVSDTETLNRAAGLAPMSLTPFESPGSPARLLGRTTYSGIPATFEEHPYEFERERYTQVRRRVTTGILKEIVARVELSPAEDGGTEVTAIFTVEPRLPFLDVFTRINVRQTVHAFVDAIVRLAVGGATPETPADAVALRAAAERLARAPDAPCAAALVDWVAQADDVSVQRIRPYVLADRLAVPRRDMLATCVAAAEAGLVSLQWQLVCPSCRNGAASVASLGDITSGEERCHACELAFALDMDTAVEAVFVPSPVVRAVPDVQYCGGGPARTPHVVAQANAEAGGFVTLQVPARAGHYRVFVRGGGSLYVDVLPGAPGALDVHPGQPHADGVQVGVGGVIRVHNGTTHAAHVKLESLNRRDDAATALDLATLSSFRRRFARQTLRAGLSLQVGRIALLFSDLAESTRLYAELGDAEAFRVVHDHFDVVSEAVTRSGGTLVKTIGDAVMAAFPDERRATRAAIDILVAFRAFRSADPRRARTDIKIGVHAGPCYAVTANNLLDYFGQTVNLAARLQGLAGSGEVVVLDVLADELRAGGAEVGEPFEVTLKGVHDAVRVVRARVSSVTTKGGAGWGR